MIRDAAHTPSPVRLSPRLFWMTALILGAVFFYKDHDVKHARHEARDPWTAARELPAAGSNVAKGVAVAMVGVLGGTLLVTGPGRQRRQAGMLGVLAVACFAWCLASVLWSTDRGLTLRQIAVLSFCLVGALGMARRFGMREVVRLMMVITLSYGLIALLLELLHGTFRPFSSGYQFAGTVHPNMQGIHMGMLTLSAFCLFRQADRHRQLYLAIFLIGASLLLMTRSRTACGATIAAIGVIWMLEYPLTTKLMVGTAGGWLAATLLLCAMLSGHDLQSGAGSAVQMGRETSQGDTGSLSGRIPIWIALADYVEHRPLIGYGYQSFWTAEHIDELSNEMQWAFREAHSGYVESTLGIGMIGTALLLLVVLGTMHRTAGAHRSTGNTSYAFFVGAMTFALLLSVMESVMIAPDLISTLLACGAAHLLFYQPAAEAAARAETAHARQAWRGYTSKRSPRLTTEQ